MSFHTMTVMIDWFVHMDEKTTQDIERLQTIPYHIRLYDENVVKYVEEMKSIWSRGTKVQRLAVLGWETSETIKLFCNIVENLDKIAEEYRENVEKYGIVPSVKNADIDEYEKVTRKQLKKISKEKAREDN